MSKETRETADNVARASLPFSAFRNESEWKDAIGFLAKQVDQALLDRDERAARIARSEVEHAAQQLTERGDEGRDILNYTDFIKGQKTAAQDILKAIRTGVADAK